MFFVCAFHEHHAVCTRAYCLYKAKMHTAADTHLARVQAFCSDKEFLVLAVSDGVAESHLGQWCTTPRVVDNVCDNTLDVPTALGHVHHPKLCCTFAMCVVRLENAATTLTLGADNATHLCV